MSQRTADGATRVIGRSSRGLRIAVISVTVAAVLSASGVLLWSPIASLLRPGGGSPAAHDSASRSNANGSNAAAQSGQGAPSGVAMPAGDLPGWRQTFADDFNGSALGGNWVAYRGRPQNDPGGYFEPSHVSVGNGLLTIGAWPDPARRGMYATGGVSNRPVLSQVYGKYEARFRMDRAAGIAYALLLWPSNNQTQAEIDIAEDNGKGRDVTYATMHSADGLAHLERSVPGDFTTWHTVGVEWSPKALVYTLDGKPWARITNSGVPTVPMSLALQSQAWYCGNSWQACPNSTTPDRANLQVDWAVAYERSS